MAVASEFVTPSMDFTYRIGIPVSGYARYEERRSDTMGVEEFEQAGESFSDCERTVRKQHRAMSVFRLSTEPYSFGI
jgi:hypothetical protein